MQSSPPTRTWPRPSSPTNSQYSLDLGALDLDRISNTSTPIPKRHVDRVLSEDIDGPTDFTLNMAKWMRGGAKGRDTARGGKCVLQSVNEQAAQAGENNEHAQQLEAPRAPQTEAGGLDGERTASHHTPSNSPPKDSPWHERPHTSTALEDGDEASSEWDPYGEASTLHPQVAHKQFLQPTVEDYFSEITPARLPSARKNGSPEQDNIEEEEEAHVSPTKSRSSTPGRPSSPTLSPVRSPVLQRDTPAQTLPRSAASLRHDNNVNLQLQQLQARCQQLESLNSALKQALDESQRIRSQEKAAQQSQIGHAERREKDLMEMKAEAYKRAEDFRAEFAEQKERLRKAEVDLEKQHGHIEELNLHHAEETRMLRDELEDQRIAHEQELQKLKEEVAERDQRDSETARVHVEELRKAAETHEAEVKALNAQWQQKAESTVPDGLESQQQLKAARQDIAFAEASRAEAEDHAADLQAELDALKLAHADDDLDSDHERASEQTKNLQTHVHELQQQLKAERMAHAAELERLHTRVEAVTTEDPKAPQDNQEAQQSLLNDAILERDAAQDSLQPLQESLAETQAEVERLKILLADSETVNATLDARISNALRRRETYWRNRVDEGEREREVMAKALMRQWGREEVGIIREPQAFEYKYALRSSVREKMAP